MLERQGSPLQTRPALKHQHFPTKLHPTLGRSVSAAGTHEESPGSASLGCLWPPLRSSPLGKAERGQGPADICQRCSGAFCSEKSEARMFGRHPPAPLVLNCQKSESCTCRRRRSPKGIRAFNHTVWRRGVCEVASVLSDSWQPCKL